jgi:hypothetical protein
MKRRKKTARKKSFIYCAIFSLCYYELDFSYDTLSEFSFLSELSAFLRTRAITFLGASRCICSENMRKKRDLEIEVEEGVLGVLSGVSLRGVRSESA